MRTLQSGKVVLTKEEWEELAAAFNDLYGVLTEAPTSVEDYFTREEFYRIAKYSSLLEGIEFVPEDWGLEDEKVSETEG